MKEQIRVSTEGRNTIRVRGERLVAGNKWNRFLEDFQVPENGEMNSVRAKFHGGILSITVQKEKVSKPQEALTPETRKEAVSQPTKDVKGGTEPQMKHGDNGNKKGQDTAVGTSQPMVEKKMFEPFSDLDDHQNIRSITPLGSNRNEVSKDNEKKDNIQKAPVDHVKAQDLDGDQRGRSFAPTLRAGNVMPRNAETETTKTSKPEKSGATGIHAENKDLYGAAKKQNYNKAMEGLNKERQLLVNMGASVLVIMALTAYVTYSFTSRFVIC